MNKLTTATVATLATGTLVAIPAAVLIAGPAQADGPEQNRYGQVAGGHYEISVERDGGHYEVSADLDRAPQGSKWKLVVRHDGKVVSTQTRSAHRDDDGGHEVDFRDLHRPNTRGADTFKVTIDRIGGANVTKTLAFR